MDVNTRWFNLDDYKTLNRDLHPIFKTDGEYMEHWRAWGCREARLCNQSQLKVENEFGNELVLHIPYFYSLWIRGLLTHPIETYNGMRPFYFFLPEHLVQERDSVRSWVEPKNRSLPSTNANEYSRRMDTSCWTPPDYKSHYKNTFFDHIYKPLLVIHNKYNDEWNSGSINFIPVHTLQHLIDAFSEKYQIVYIRAAPHRIKPGAGFSWDVNTEYPFDEDFRWIREHPHHGVLTLEDMMNWPAMEGMNYNQIKLNLYAMCDNYITCQGGGAYMIGYFAKRMIVYHKRGGKEWETGIYQDHSWLQNQLNPANAMKLIAIQREDQLISGSKQLFQ